MAYCHDSVTAMPMIISYLQLKLLLSLSLSLLIIIINLFISFSSYYDGLFQRVRSWTGEESSSLSDSTSVNSYDGIGQEIPSLALPSSSLVEECLLFCCRAYAGQGLTSQSEKILQIVEAGENRTLVSQVRGWNEVSVVYFLNIHY